MPPWERRLVMVPFAVLSALVVLFALWDVAVPPLIEAMTAGRTIPALDALLDTHRRADLAHRDVAYYVRNGRTLLGQAIIMATGIALAALGVVRRRRVIEATRTFFTASGPALNLAVFRIVLFTVFLVDVEKTPVTFYGQLPRELLMPPRGLAWFPQLVPTSPGTVETMLLVFRISCVAAIVGLFTRPATIVALLSGAYVNAISQLSGLLYADHHLLWFGALLAASPCADALSVDALRSAWRRGAAAPPAPSGAYALPLRFVWILFCTIYFFPGFWKVWRTGFAWVSAENMRNHMHLKWREFGDWTPSLRIDDLPLALWASAIGTVVFELGFAVLALRSRLRPLAIAAGLLFHNLTWLLLRIHFWTLQASYAALIDWAALLRRRPEPAPASASVPRATAIVGTVVVAAAVGTGAQLIPLSWPFTVYPTFGVLAGTTRPDLVARVVVGSGREENVDLRALNASVAGGFQRERLQGLMDHILNERDPTARDAQLRAFWRVLTRGDARLSEATTVRFYRDMNATDPKRHHENPLAHDLLWEVRF